MTVNLAFYTCFYGIEDNVAFKIPPIPSIDYPCFYYTNNQQMFDKIKETLWIGIYDDKPYHNYFDSCMDSKNIKAMPHRYKELQQYDYTCYLDSKLGQVNVSFVLDYIETYFVKQNYALLLREHWYNDRNVWSEFFDSMNYERYHSHGDRIRNYIQSQIDAGLKELQPHHSATGFLIRNMKHPEINRLNEIWYQHILVCGIQCQIAFFFAKQFFPEDCILSFTEYPYLT
jgi:hypothetical protein